jgi:hypothetical protein
MIQKNTEMMFPPVIQALSMLELVLKHSPLSIWSAINLAPYQNPNAYVRKEMQYDSPFAIPSLNPFFTPISQAFKINVLYLLMASLWAFSAVTVRIALKYSVANPPAAAYCSRDSFCADVTARIMNAPAIPIIGIDASSTNVSFQHRIKAAIKEKVNCVPF